jgi:hypothetical protein
VSEWVSERCLTPNGQFFSYILPRTSYIAIWNDDEVRFVLDQQAWLDLYTDNALKQVHELTCPITRTHNALKQVHELTCPITRTHNALKQVHELTCLITRTHSALKQVLELTCPITRTHYPEPTSLCSESLMFIEDSANTNFIVLGLTLPRGSNSWSTAREVHTRGIANASIK